MAELTEDQLNDLRADLAITDTEAVWTDDELHRLYTRGGSDYNMTLWLALRQLYIASLRENDYTAGQTSEKRSQITANLKDALDTVWTTISRTNQIRFAGLRSVPPIARDIPTTEEDPDLRGRLWRDRRYGV
jgi:hypothetical protein